MDKNLGKTGRDVTGIGATACARQEWKVLDFPLTEYHHARSLDTSFVENKNGVVHCVNPRLVIGF